MRVLRALSLFPLAMDPTPAAPPSKSTALAGFQEYVLILGARQKAVPARPEDPEIHKAAEGGGSCRRGPVASVPVAKQRV
jgi:hypothetical protein